MSFFVTRPLMPVPCSAVMSTPCSAAIFRTTGDDFVRRRSSTVVGPVAGVACVAAVAVGAAGAVDWVSVLVSAAAGALEAAMPDARAHFIAAVCRRLADAA